MRTRTQVIVLAAMVGLIAALFAHYAYPTSFTVTDPNCPAWSWNGSSTLSCASSGTPPACSVSGAAQGTVGTPVPLTANCTGSPTAYAWTGGSCAGVTIPTCNATATGAGSVNYSVTATNQYGTSPPALKSVLWSSGVISCGSPYSNTKVANATIPENGGALVRYFTYNSIFNNSGTSTSPGFGANDAVIMRFTTPAAEQYFAIQFTETGGVNGAPTFRTISLSKAPCDFAIPKSPNAVFARQDTGLSATLSVGSSPYASYNLDPNTTYYLNVSNTAYGQQQCSAAQCNVFFTFSNPTP